MEFPHILVVDDDMEIRELLAEYLSKNEYRVTTAPDGAGMRMCLSRLSIDLVVLDIMLRGDDGLALCREVRSESSVPIIMLTARGDPIDKIIGFEMGADDYLAKPFLPRELLARIKSILRRVDRSGSQELSAVRYRFASWCLNTETRNLTDQAGVVTPLSGSEYRLLVKLLAANKRVLSRAQLTDGGTRRANNQFDRGIDVCVGRLRQILRDPSLIKTVHGEGYVIGVEVFLP
jgi:two-component system, OmpR family, response regulator